MRSTDLICLVLLGLCTLTTARPDNKAQCGYPVILYKYYLNFNVFYLHRASFYTTIKCIK